MIEKTKRDSKTLGRYMFALLILLAAGILTVAIFYPRNTSTPEQHITKDVSEFTEDVYFKPDEEQTLTTVAFWDCGDVDGDVLQALGAEIPLLSVRQYVSLPYWMGPGMYVEVGGVKDGYSGVITVGISVPGCTPTERIMCIKPGQIGRIYFE